MRNESVDPTRAFLSVRAAVAAGNEPVAPARARALPAELRFESLLRSALEPGALPSPAATEPGGLPLDGKGADTLRAQRTELELRVAFLREMLAPLLESLSGGLGGGGGVAGSDVYEFFVGEALSRPLAEGWPLPSPLPRDLTATSASRFDAIEIARTRAEIGAARPDIGTTRPDIGTTRADSGAARTEIGAVRADIGPARAARSAPAVPSPARTGGVDEADPDAIAETAARRPTAALPPSLASARALTPMEEGSAPQPAVPGTRPTRLDDLVARTAKEFALPESLLHAVVRVESNGNPRAVSPKGAQGLMQLMPGTARELGVRDPFDAEENLRGGARYLAQQIERFGDLPRALAAYNAGPGAVAKHGGIPPFRETRAYVDRVLRLVEAWER